MLWHVEASIKSFKILKIACAKVHFKQNLSKDVSHSKLSFGQTAFQAGTSHVIESA